MIRIGLTLAFACTLAACGGAPAAMTAAPAPARAETASAAPPVREASPAQGIRRSSVHAAVSAGLGYLLQKVAFEDRPVMRGGKFVGFRVAALRDERFWT